MRQLQLPYDTLQIILSYTDIFHHSTESRKLYKSMQDDDTEYMSSRLLIPRKYRKYLRPSRVIISVQSKDQGWSSHEVQGQRGSHTWGEVAIGGLVVYEGTGYGSRQRL